MIYWVISENSLFVSAFLASILSKSSLKLASLASFDSSFSWKPRKRKFKSLKSLLKF